MEYNVYVDESGDEGIQRGSRWFIMSAVIVPKDFDLTLSNRIVKIKESFNMKRKDQLHWNKLSHNRRIKTIEYLVGENFKIIHVAIDTYKIYNMIPKQVYPYFMSYLIERITFYVKNRRSTCNIYISTRHDNNLKTNEYLKEEFMNKRNYHYINYNCINNIKFQDNGKLNLLQLADICCSSFAQAIKFNTSTEWNYVFSLSSNIYSNNKGVILGCGIKFYPNLKWFKEYPVLIKLKK